MHADQIQAYQMQMQACLPLTEIELVLWDGESFETAQKRPDVYNSLRYTGTREQARALLGLLGTRFDDCDFRPISGPAKRGREWVFQLDTTE